MKLMERRELVALLTLLLILVGLPVVTLGYQYGLRLALAPTQVVDIQAAVPEAGGFQPDSVRVAVGQPVTLRFASLDVTHGVAIGPGLGVDLGHVDPGQVKEVTLTFDRPGTYTYYCNSWCSPNHWRMRGVIQVYDPVHPEAQPTSQTDPVIAALLAEGVDIDAPRTSDGDPSRETGPMVRPSIERGKTLAATLSIPTELQTLAWRRSHTPAQGLARLAAANPDISEADLTHVVAYLWLSHLSSEQQSAAATLYAKNCAACHGQTGGGEGPAAELTAEEPASFTNPATMWQRRSDVLYAKIRRGGMGTDMPNFGTLFTPEETWALVDLLWTFALTPQTVTTQSMSEYSQSGENP